VTNADRIIASYSGMNRESNELFLRYRLPCIQCVLNVRYPSIAIPRSVLRFTKHRASRYVELKTTNLDLAGTMIQIGMHRPIRTLGGPIAEHHHRMFQFSTGYSSRLRTRFRLSLAMVVINGRRKDRKTIRKT
jgi:hypothetical protein